MLPLSFQIVPMLAHHNDATAAEVLAFLSVFLYDGNEIVQVRLMCVLTFVGGRIVVSVLLATVRSLGVSDITPVLFHAYTHVLMHSCMRSHLHSFTHAHVHTCTHAHIHSCTHTQMHTYTHAHIHSCTHAHIHLCTHAHMHSCTHALILDTCSQPCAGWLCILDSDQRGAVLRQHTKEA